MALLANSGIMFDTAALPASGTLASSILQTNDRALIGIDIYVANASATSQGTLAVQVCNDISGTPNWVPITFSDTTTYLTITSGDDVRAFADLFGTAAKYIRLLWTTSSGTGGTIKAVATSKMGGM